MPHRPVKATEFGLLRTFALIAEASKVWLGLVVAWGAFPLAAGEPPGPEPTWWAFRELGSPRPPIDLGRDTSRRAIHPIDAFIDARLGQAGIVPHPSAAARDLVRRVSYDLTGLQPTAGAVREFEQDPSEARWMSLVDRLLASPQYGERWARHWLDVVRFAQSNGYERDPEKLFAWRYRDYVIQSLNSDKPYDQFIREQIAGDLLARKAAANGLATSATWRDPWIATGFLHLGVMDDEPDDKELAEFDALDDVVGTTGAAFLGLTLNCARCHDHKFDPIPQKDYYSLLSFFRGLRSPSKPGLVPDSALYGPLATPNELARWQDQHREKIERLKRSLAESSDESARKSINGRLKELEEALPPFDHGLVAREREAGKVPPVQVLLRGNPRTPGDRVEPGFPDALRFAGLCESRAEWAAQPSLRRLALADWIASPNNPLTARVMVNRIWHHHFGKGLVKSTMDFGRAGFKPTHPELLDWLAREFIQSGWSIKHIHRLILTSRTWRRASRGQDAIATKADPDNDLWWRHSVRRLDAESLRDTLLQVSGQLNLAPGGRGFFPCLSGEVLAGGSRPGTDWEVSTEAEASRRSIYSFIRRSSMVPLFETFDYSNVSSPLGERPTTTVAPQALLMINDRFLQEQSSALAARILRREGTDENIWVDASWKAVLGRSPNPTERRRSLDFLHRQQQAFEGRRRRMLFRPDVPDTLSTGYFEKLAGRHFLLGPSAGWTVYKGSWPREYEGNRNMDPGRGPFALWEGDRYLDGTLDCRVSPKIACETVSLLTRSVPEAGVDSGYELCFQLRAGRVELRRLQGGQVAVLSHAAAALPFEEDTRVRWQWTGDAYAVWVGDGDRELLAGRDPAPLRRAGQIGLRVWGAGVELDQVSVGTAAGVRTLQEVPERTNPQRRALESLELLLMNLNELAYVD